MKEHQILFSGPMIRALLAGTKSQTRRLITTRHPLSHIGPRGSEDDPDEWGYFFDGPAHNGYMVLGRGHNECHNHGLVSIPCPYGEVGDHLWVRETWCLADPEYYEVGTDDGRPRGPRREVAYYRSTDDVEGKDNRSPWRPSIFMPRWASRIMLEVTDIRVQRLQAIGEEDARAEGVRIADAATAKQDSVDTHGMSPFRAAFACLWDSINSKRAPWADNPFVWALTFKRMP